MNYFVMLFEMASQQQLTISDYLFSEIMEIISKNFLDAHEKFFIQNLQQKTQQNQKVLFDKIETQGPGLDPNIKSFCEEFGFVAEGD